MVDLATQKWTYNLVFSSSTTITIEGLQAELAPTMRFLLAAQRSRRAPESSPISVQRLRSERLGRYGSCSLLGPFYPWRPDA